MRHFCTLFDSKYLAKGLSLHASLLRHSSEPFTLWILAMDDETAAILHELNLPNVRILPLNSFEADMKMGPVKASRTLVEYFWTAASNLCEYLLRRFDGIQMLAYLDADLFFFSDPKAIFDEIGERSIAIVPHRFAEHDRARLEPNGIYNVGWVTFAADPYGLGCVSKWAEECRDWCFNKKDPDRFGDQKYLDSWPLQYQERLAVIQNIGANVAPWNLQQYDLDMSGLGAPLVNARPIIFYHFHEYVSDADLTRWPLRLCDKQLIYAPYVWELREQSKAIAITRNAIRQRQQQMEAEWQRA